MKGLDIHVHGFSPPEIWHFAEIAGLSIAEVIARLRKAGLDSIPGGGAEIFAEGFEVATAITLTLLERDFEGDVTFPNFSTDEFVEESRVAFPDSSEPFKVVTYRRK